MGTLIRLPLERKTAVADVPSIARRSSDPLTHSVTRFEFKAIATEKRQFTGLSSTWDLDLGGDLIEKGAYRRTLREWKASGRRVAARLDVASRDSAARQGRLRPGLDSTFAAPSVANERRRECTTANWTIRSLAVTNRRT